MLRLLTGPDLAPADIFAFHAEHEERVRQMTDDQTKMLGLLRHQHRIAVVGGAGSGKTWLALEQTRRLAKDGQSVALVCYSRGLAHFLQRVTGAWKASERPSYVGLFHDLPVTWGAPRGAEDDSLWFEEELPALLGQLVPGRPVSDRFDSIVVDEGQDFSGSWWPPTLLALKDPDKGGLYVFLDEGQRVFDRSDATPIELAPFPLDSNLRNTKRIAQVLGSLCLEQPKYAGLEGPPVRFIACSRRCTDTLCRPTRSSGRARTGTGTTSSPETTSSTVTCSASRAWSGRLSCWRSTGSVTSHGPRRCCMSG